jgi:hypothetical protein
MSIIAPPGVILRWQHRSGLRSGLFLATQRTGIHQKRPPMEAATQPSIPKPVRRTVEYRPDPRIRYGAARRRQGRRQRQRRWLGGLARGFALVWLLSGAMLPVMMHSYRVTQAAPVESPSQDHFRLEKLSKVASSVEILPVTAAPTQTATPTPLPTATPTPTILPPILIQATAWQATLDTAEGLSHATQTQAAAQYATTQTALPPILTANAVERENTATAAVR